MQIPDISIPITELSNDFGVRLSIKREDLIHPRISGNKYWKLLYNFNFYIESQPLNPEIITFGGAFSNHIAAVAALGKISGLPTLGIIRGEELAENRTKNPTLNQAEQDGMRFLFVSRTDYKDKERLSKQMKEQFPDALIIPEGGTNELAVKGIKWMLNEQTKDFDYLCTASGTGGTVSGLTCFAEPYQKIIGFKVVNDDSLEEATKKLSGNRKIEWERADFGGYGKINDELIRFINGFREQYGIPLDPVYTGKMMFRLWQKLENGEFSEGSRILCFHTGGLQGIKGINAVLKKKKKPLITE